MVRLTLHRAAAVALALALVSAPASAQEVGVSAAVNPAATGTPPGQAIRTITLGDNIVHNERVQTSDGGLVQILFLDGTTLTVGPRSDLVIDSFLYDPGAGTAKLAATMTKGVLRFIGGTTSKTPDGVNIDTPVGTIGVRGAIADITLSPPSGTPPHIDLLFGNEVTLSQGGALIGRLYEGGYSLVLGGDQVQVQKTPAEWSSQIQAALSSRPGARGGAPRSPTSQTVAESGIPEANSELGADLNAPPSAVPPMSPIEQAQLLEAAASYDYLRRFIVDQPPPNEPPPEEPPPNEPPPPPTGIGELGAASAIVRIDNYENGTQTEQRHVPFVTTGFAITSSEFTQIRFNEQGMPVGGSISIMAVADDCEACVLFFKLDENGTTLSAIDQAGTYRETQAQGYLVDHSQASLPAGVAYCECAFLNWGYWGVQGTLDLGNGQTAAIDLDNGLWVVGDMTSAEELDTLGAQEMAGTVATYNGHAIGTASAGGGPGYAAAGAMTMDYSFGTRQGTMAISDFDGRDFTGIIAGAEGVPYFVGGLSGDGSGAVAGGFANDGDALAAGAAGNFFLEDDAWQATGVFMGER